MAAMIPVLQTARLRLREWRLADFEPFAALRGDPELQAYVGGARSREAAWEDFCAAAGHWVMRGVGIFLVAERASDTAVGYAGLWFPIDLAEPELCWSLFPGHFGKGYATEAAAAAQDWAARERGLDPLMSFVHPGNRASRAVAERLGARLAGETTLRGAARLVYRHRTVLEDGG